MRVPVSGVAPGFNEQEVVVLQQAPPDTTQEPIGAFPAQTDDRSVWAACKFGLVDPRPYFAQILRDRMKRIMDHGGAVICFCEPKPSGRLIDADGGVTRPLFHYGDLDWSVWSLVAALDSFHVTADHGEEIRVETGQGWLAPLASHLESASFNCTLQPGWQESRWMPLAKNKFGADVAGILFPENEPQGYAVLLPQVKDHGAAVRAILDDILPLLLPTLFPESQKFGWRHQVLYELPEITRLEGQIAAVRAEAEAREAELREHVASARNEDGWMHELLTETADKLVDAVHRALRELGFEDVRNADEEAERRQTELREDLQIHDRRPIILVEVKGLSALPKEEDSLAVTKYVAPRMREWKHTDVRGLAVINHQRALPPLQRENKHTFQDDVLENAQHQGFGLLTTFELYRLVINKRRLGWADSAVMPLLYENGRINIVPTHYQFVGEVDGFFEDISVVTIGVSGVEFAVADRLAFELPINFAEMQVPSIQIDRVDVERAGPGQRVAVKTTLTKAQARTGVRVYRAATTA